jgi:predicted nucleotidyltransferase
MPLQSIGIENYLGETVGIKTHPVMKDSLKPRIGRQILKEVHIRRKGTF